MPNKVTIFSNGIADFRRTYDTAKGSVSIPVKKPHIGDVLASLNVYGAVKLKKPPSFIPENETQASLSFNHANLLCDLTTKLVGARVKIDRATNGSIEGTLFGLVPMQEGTGGEAVTRHAMSLLTDAGVQNVPFSSITNVCFLDEAIQAEVDKALRRQFEKIRPLSTTINLEVEPDTDPECEVVQSDFIVHYTVPAAAWKISYRLNCNSENCSLDGFAVVDNNTEEDWNDFIVSVVTGEPITFGTDLARAKIPARNSINVVADSAVGPVEGRALAAMGFQGATGPTGPTGPTGNSKRKATRGYSDDDANVLQQLASGDAQMDIYYTDEPGLEAEVETHEIGDFSIFESANPISIGAGESATIPVFNTDLNENEQILFYRKKDHKDRPFRAIKFINETDHSLGRGVCTVYDDGVYAGSCVLSCCKPGEKQILPHALETGAKVEELSCLHSNDFMSLKVSKGVGTTAMHYCVTTTYRVTNSRDQEFKFVFDYDHLLPYNGKRAVKASLNDQEIPVEEHPGFQRMMFLLPPNGQYQFVVEETISVETSTVLEGNRAVSWFDLNIIQRDIPIGDNQNLRFGIELRKKIDTLEDDIEKAEKAREVAVEQQERVIKLLGSCPDNDNWKGDLSITEDEIRKIDRETLPNLRQEILRTSEEFHKQMEKITYEWVH